MWWCHGGIWKETMLWVEGHDLPLALGAKHIDLQRGILLMRRSIFLFLFCFNLTLSMKKMWFYREQSMKSMIWTHVPLIHRPFSMWLLIQYRASILWSWWFSFSNVHHFTQVDIFYYFLIFCFRLVTQLAYHFISLFCKVWITKVILFFKGCSSCLAVYPLIVVGVQFLTILNRKNLLISILPLNKLADVWEISLESIEYRDTLINTEFSFHNFI